MRSGDFCTSAPGLGLVAFRICAGQRLASFFSPSEKARPLVQKSGFELRGGRQRSLLVQKSEFAERDGKVAERDGKVAERERREGRRHLRTRASARIRQARHGTGDFCTSAPGLGLAAFRICAGNGLASSFSPSEKGCLLVHKSGFERRERRDDGAGPRDDGEKGGRNAKKGRTRRSDPLSARCA